MSNNCVFQALFPRSRCMEQIRDVSVTGSFLKRPQCLCGACACTMEWQPEAWPHLTVEGLLESPERKPRAQQPHLSGSK